MTWGKVDPDIVAGLGDLLYRLDDRVTALDRVRPSSARGTSVTAVVRPASQAVRNDSAGIRRAAAPDRQAAGPARSTFLRSPGTQGGSSTSTKWARPEISSCSLTIEQVNRVTSAGYARAGRRPCRSRSRGTRSRGRDHEARRAGRLRDRDGVRTGSGCNRGRGGCADLRGQGEAGGQSADRSRHGYRTGTRMCAGLAGACTSAWLLASGPGRSRSCSIARSIIPDIVTAGRETVGIRAPRGLVARGLIERVGGPIAAPSANRSNRISPTRAEHVVADLGGEIELVIDSGPTAVGIESTVVDLTGDIPRVLRPGPISRADLEAALPGETRDRRWFRARA